ncbi:hypothetical protein LX36DRAFT_723014 [Colletotrichum falcatum]|nr:hypothetical protein LX36DRAFT_723014 [Colletotrichum falcatum]
MQDPEKEPKSPRASDYSYTFDNGPLLHKRWLEGLPSPENGIQHRIRRQLKAHNVLCFMYGISMLSSLIANVYLLAQPPPRQIGADASGWISQSEAKMAWKDLFPGGEGWLGATEEEVKKYNLLANERAPFGPTGRPRTSLGWFVQHQHFRAIAGKELVLPNEHFAHCIELLAQSIKCFGDLSTGGQTIHMCKKQSQLDDLFHRKRIVDEDYAWNHSVPVGVQIQSIESDSGHGSSF